MVKGGSGQEPNAEPTSFPQTTPPVSGDVSAWVLTAINKMEGTLGRIEATQVTLQGQMARVETTLDGLKDTVSGHEKWVHTFKYVLGGFGVLFACLITYVVGPWLTKRIIGP